MHQLHPVVVRKMNTNGCESNMLRKNNIKIDSIKWLTLSISLAVIIMISGCAVPNSKTNNSQYEGTREIVDDKLIENMVKTEIHNIHELIKKDEQTPAEIARIIHSFRDLEPEYYHNIEGANFYEVVDWLYQLDTPIKQNHIDDIFTLHDQLDGAASETYSAMMYELFQEAPLQFVQSLSNCETEKIKHIASMIAYHAGYFDSSEVIANTKLIFSSKKLSTKEKSTVEEILNALGSE